MTLPSIIVRFMRLGRPLKYGAAVAVTCLVAAAFVFFPAKESTGLKTVLARRAPLRIEMVESGEIQAINSQLIRAPQERIELQVVELVPEGTRVNEGDLLVRFDTTQLLEEVESARDNLAQAEADLKSLDTQQASSMAELATNLEIARYSLEAAELQLTLLQFESASRQQEARLGFEQEKLRFGEAEKALETKAITNRATRGKSLLALEQARTQLANAQQRITTLTVRAPIPGLVVYNTIGGASGQPVTIALGDKVNPGTSFMSIPDLSAMKLTLKVNEMDGALLVRGMAVLVRLDAYDDEVFHGVVDDIARLVERSSPTRGPFMKPPSYTVVVRIDEADMKLKPGMTARARIVLSTTPDALAIPAGAVFEDANGSPVVYTGRRWPDPTPVTLGGRGDHMIVIADGIAEGETISLAAPPGADRPLGWFAEMERRRTEREEFLKHLDTLETMPAPEVPDGSQSATGGGGGGGGGVAIQGGMIMIR